MIAVGREQRSDSRLSLGFAAVLIAGAAASVAWTMFLGWAVAKFVGPRVMLTNAGVSFLNEYWPSLVLAVLVVVLMVRLRRASGRIRAIERTLHKLLQRGDSTTPN